MRRGWNSSPTAARFFEDDEVYTSGHAGMLPRGLRIGVVASGQTNGYRVRPYATLSELEFVSVLFFDSPLVMATEPGPRRLRAAEAAPAEPKTARQTESVVGGHGSQSGYETPGPAADSAALMHIAGDRHKGLSR